MDRYWVFCAAMSVALFVLAGVLFLDESAESAADEIEPQLVNSSGNLLVQRRTDVRISGVYGYAGSQVVFNSILDPTSQVVNASLVVNGKVIQARRDITTDAIVFDGHDNTLSTAEQQALTAAITDLDLTTIGQSGTPAQEDLLYRLLEYVSMAPAGTMLEQHTVPKAIVLYEPVSGEELQQPVEFKLVSAKTASWQATEPPAPSDNCSEAVSTAPWDVTTQFVACQRSDNDGISYLNCETKYRGASYDGKDNCFQTFSIHSGPGSSKCKGRCGPGCGLRDRGKYTQDCLDHDACCGRYGGCANGVFGSCSDEFRDADDDVFRAKRNCRNG